MDTSRLHPRPAALLLWAVFLAVQPLAAQQDYGGLLGRREGADAIYYPSGTNLRMEAVRPSVQKWYIPQGQTSQYRRQWEFTNYAKQRYQRYLEPSLEGNDFYDIFGRNLQRGWLVYDWRQDHPQSFDGSSLLKSNQYGSWFSKLVVSSDSWGQHNFSVVIGDEIRATLTPMTFQKTAFNGVLFNYAADRVDAQILTSRVSLPVIFTDSNPSLSNNLTNLVGGRATWQITDFARIGGTYVNAHNGRTASDRFDSSPFKGGLTSGQLDGRIDRIVLRLTDDSPGDNAGGAMLFASDVEIHTRLGERDTVLVGSEIGFVARVRGGARRDGVLVAEGRGEAAAILLEYVFSDEDPAVADLESILPDADLVNNISRVRFHLELSNDYHVEVTSNRQTDNSRAGEQPQYLTVARARGNVQDNSNQGTVSFDYGLPTATQVFGLTLEVDDLAGFEMYAEYNINHRFTQYPTRSRDSHTSSSGTLQNRFATGWMVTASRQFSPFYAYGEAFGMDPEYDTSPRFVDTGGRIDWSDTEVARSRHVYDFVDDNDDNDRKNDQNRRFDDGRLSEEQPIGRSVDGFADEAVFPGLDENNDFISDFNQNSLPIRPNFLPDYEEPFLRHDVDRPEYLFALDLNNNGWGDRFENDDAPDYPYQRDRRGYNVYVGTRLRTMARITVGRTGVRQPSTGDRGRTTYGLLAWEHDVPRWGTVSLYDMVKLVRDDISEDLVQWIQPRPIQGRPQDSPGGMAPIRDPLALRDALVNKLFIGYDLGHTDGFDTESKLIYERIRQGEKGTVDRDGLAISHTTRRFGLINKADYLHRFGRISLQPKFKTELFMDDTPFSIERQLGNPQAERHDWTGILSLQLRIPFMKHSAIHLGLERLHFRDFVQDEVSIDEEPDGLSIGDITGDYNEMSYAFQLSNSSPYLGYKLMMQVGLRVDKRRLERWDRKDDTVTSALSFISVQAGLRD
jgi:hypothetical protein